MRRVVFEGVTVCGTWLKSAISELRNFVFDAVPVLERQGGLVRFFKGSLSYLRGNDLSLLQISKWSRALPDGNADIVSAALAAHKVNYTMTPFTSSPELLTKIREFGRLWAKKHRRTITHGLASGLCSHSTALTSCYEKSIRQGGRAFVDNERFNNCSKRLET